MNANYCRCPLLQSPRAEIKWDLSEVSQYSVSFVGRASVKIECVTPTRERRHACTLYAICTLKPASYALTKPSSTYTRAHKISASTHTHTGTHTRGWNLMECDLVWSLCVGSLICMQALFSNIPRPMIIIINPDWGIGTPNLTGLYGSSHSCRTGVTLYYASVTLSYTPRITDCWKLKINDLREHYFWKLHKSSLTHILQIT